ncbi:carboxypeptidase M32 [Paenibacillus protaetiae]|uniref:Metal-dependent carboxypeptidase n=1 Tax=Paenibacillus protaetiae TaxID=2509456 RepID=A0A4P6EZC3_9BACL|nr:carboxypeptidase M32 [Paenibacillus protaetiae]QAY66067.1 carboxypeptidase M32 [Paenibacillus protaetiae]
MTTSTVQALPKFLETIRKIKSYEEALGVLYWDLRTGAPRGGMEARSEAIGHLSADMFRYQTSAELGEQLAELEQPEAFAQLSEIEQKLVKETRKEYDRNAKIPAKLYQEYVVLASQSESKWEECKDNDDFASFEPYLDKIISYQQQFIDLWGAAKGTRYDTLLDLYEPGLTTAELDRVFGGLRDQLVPLASAIAASPHQPDTSFLQQKFAIAGQKELGNYILKQMGFSFDKGRVDESVHPFATGLNPGDVRITTHYYEEDIASALFSSLHEGGHALYEQNIRAELTGTTLSGGTSMGIHESQSRFWENVVGRSKPFWHRYYRELQSFFPGQLNVSAEDFYRAINVVEPSLIRIEADELTYNLHIIIRYEIEKLIFNEGVKAADLPAIWNEKYKQYLGIEPPNNAQGVLQDVHWSGGLFGYFPSYSLGNMYAAQFAATMEQEIEGFWNLVEEGNLLPIKQWLSEKIYQHGKLKTPSELIQGVTGKPLDSGYLVRYLTDKYSDIYKL